VLRAKAVLGQFVWQEVDGGVADHAARLQAGLVVQGKLLDFADVLIAASALACGADALVTENKAHFAVHKALQGKVFTAKELLAKTRRKT
jgi:predicted nucleic acid-binding protein